MEQRVKLLIRMESEASMLVVRWLQSVLTKAQGRLFLVSLFSWLTIRFQYYCILFLAD